MIVLLSPAKDLDMTPTRTPAATQPRFLADSQRLVERLRTYSPKRLAALMDLSPKLAEVNHQRYQEWSLPFTGENAKPAAAAFNGEVFKGLGFTKLEAPDIRFAQDHVRILSGLYGVLRPLDLIQAYRLEMGCGFGMGRGAKDLYAFWGDRITGAIKEDLKAVEADVVINLASTEYTRAVRFAELGARTITPVFKDKTPGGYRMLMLFAKQQRGRMCRWIIQHRLAAPERLKDYAQDGYRYDPGLSTEHEWVYTRDRR